MKFLIIFSKTSSIQLGMPCTFVRNCVVPPTTICIISLFLSSIGCPWLHLLRLFCILSSSGSHGAVSLVLFPIHALRDCTALPSADMCTELWSDSLSGCSRLVFRTLSWYCVVPIGMISVFVVLNFTPDIVHYLDRMSCRSSYLSSFARYIVMLSVNRFIRILLGTCGT